MFCTSCGKRLELGMKFCPACGAAVDWSTQAGAASASERGAGAAGAPPPPPPGYAGAPPRPGQLLRPRQGRMIAGVCAAFALQYGWDVTIVRILTVVLALFTIVGAAAYFIAWLVIPEAPYALPNSSL